MSTFREQLEDDLNVFFNAEEFAEEHELNGTMCSCIVQSPTAREVFLQGQAYDSYEGISGRQIIVHVKKSELPEIPAEGMTFTLDGEVMLVSACVEDMGNISITLHQNLR